MALDRAALPAGSGLRESIDRGTRWMTGMQSKDGGWGAFDADNTRRLVTRLPFCDFGEVIDPPSADVTAHVVEALAKQGLGGTRPARRGVAWLLRAQESDGSWFGRWGSNYIYGTGAVVPALIEAGVLPTKPVIRRAVRWLVTAPERRRRLGRGPALLRARRRPGRRAAAGAPIRSWAGRGESTASQTAWALMALLAAVGPQGTDEAEREAIERGVRWLADTQRAGRELGRAAVHRDRLPRRLLHQLPPVPAGLPGQRARPLPGAVHAASHGSIHGAVPVERRGELPAGPPATRLAVCAPLRIEARAARRGLASHGRGAAHRLRRPAVRRGGAAAARLRRATRWPSPAPAAAWPPAWCPVT